MDEKLTNRMDEFFKSIAEQVNEMIPVVWNTFYLFGELADDSSGGVYCTQNLGDKIICVVFLIEQYIFLS